MLISSIYGSNAPNKAADKKRNKRRRKLRALLRAGKISKAAYQARLNRSGKRKRGGGLLDSSLTVRGYGEFRR